nr:beta-L-arabinofuranosidase domain-containing protein [Algoriphagus antarcticus]
MAFTGRKVDIQFTLNKMGQKIIFSKTFGIHVSVLLGCFFVSASSCKTVESDTEKENLPKFESNRENGIPSVFEAGKTSFENFDIAAGKTEGEQNQRMASDSDFYKIIQGVAYSLQHTPDKELEAFTDSLIDRIVAAQQDDGYLFTYWTAINPDKRWTNINKDHELYCVGHFFEAAIAYYEVTGKRKLLDAAIKLADHIGSIFGPGKRIDIRGHQEIELALYKLYQTTCDISLIILGQIGRKAT